MLQFLILLSSTDIITFKKTRLLGVSQHFTFKTKSSELNSELSLYLFYVLSECVVFSELEAVKVLVCTV